MAKFAVASAYAAYAAHPDTPGKLDDLLQAVICYSLAVCTKRGIRVATAEDIAQDTALEVWRKLGTYDPTRSSVKTWVHRCTLDQVSIHRRRGQQHLKDVKAHLVRPEEPREVSPELITRIMELAGNDADLVDLLAVHGSISEAASKLGITVAAARKRLTRLVTRINAVTCPQILGQMP